MLHAGVAALSEAYLWLFVPDGEGLEEAAWMMSPIIYWVPLILLLFIWCVVDSRNRNVKRPVGAIFLVPLLFPIGVPYYYWRTYPPRAALVHIGLFVVFAVGCVTALWVGRKLVFLYFLAA